MRNQDIEDMGMFRMAFNCVNNGLLIIDRAQMTFLDANAAACKMLGYTRKELLLLTPEQIQPFYAKEIFAAKFDETIHSDVKTAFIETFCLRKDKSGFDAEICLCAFNYKGKDLGLSAITDISERKQLQAVHTVNATPSPHYVFLENSRNGFLEQTTDAFLSLDKNWCCNYINKTAAVILGLEPKSVTGKNIWELLPGYTKGVFYDALQRSAGEEKYVYLEAFEPSFNRWVECHIYPSATGLSVFFRDITGYRQMKEELSRSKQRFELIGFATQDAIWEWDMVSGESHHNDAFLRLFAETGLEPAIELWKSKLHPEDRERILSSIADVTGNAVTSVWQEEFRFLKPDGAYGIFHDRGFVIRDDQGKAIRMIGSMMDITERKQAENALRESEAKYRYLFEDAGDAIVVFSAETRRFIEVNKKAIELTGYSREELLQLNIGELIFPGYLIDNPLPFPGMGGIPVIKNEKRLWRKDGSALEVENIVKMMPDGNYLGFIRDITARKKAAEELAESENRMRTILQTEPESVILLSAEGLLLEINPAGIEITEAENDVQLLGLQMIDFVQPRYRQAFRNLIHDVFNDKPGKLEFKMMGLRGTERWMEIHAVPLKNASGNIMSLLGLSRDITDRRKSEEILRQSYTDIRLLTSHLQEVREEERTRMAREIHDELGQQLTGIKMDVFWLTREGKLGKDQKNRIKGILDLLDDTINTVRRIAAELRPTLLDDLGLVEALKLHSMEFEKRSGIQVHFSTDLEDIKIAPKAAIGLFRIFQESLTNVARHADARSVTGVLMNGGDKIFLKISDDGKGFDTTGIGRTKTLGLLGMKERILMMDGKYEISSQPGHGTQIVITIPMESILAKPVNLAHA